jgi:hypothetical protein
MHGRTYIFWANLTPFSLQRWDAEQGLGRHELQLEIVSRGLELLKPGGRLVYSTVRARAGRGHAAFAFSTVNRVSIAALCGRVGRLTAKNGGSRPW